METKTDGLARATDPDVRKKRSVVDAVCLMPGQAGTNQGTLYITDTDPASVPNLKLVVMDADGPILVDRFALASRPKAWAGEKTDYETPEGVPIENPKTPDGNLVDNLQKWIESGRLKTIQFGLEELDGQGKPKKLFGAGGNITVGEKIIRRSINEIRNVLADQDFAFIWSGAGGGIGTPSAKVLAETCVELKIPLTTILITPFENQGNKMAIADTLREAMREMGPQLVIHNAMFPKEKKGVPYSEIYRQINIECRGIFKALIQITMFTGTNNNVDLNDLLTAMAMGKDMSISVHTISRGKDGVVPEIVVGEVIRDLMNPLLQTKGITTEAILFCFEGPWPGTMVDEIQAGIQAATHFPVSGFTKWQDNEQSAEMAVTMICFGSFERNPVVMSEPIALPLPEHISDRLALWPQTEADAPPATVPIDEVSNGNGRNGSATARLRDARPAGLALTTISFMSGGEQKRADVSADLARRFRSYSEIASTLEETNRLFDDVKDATGYRPNMPKRYAESTMWGGLHR